MTDTLLFKGTNLTIREGRVKNPAPFLTRVGAMMKARVKSTFVDQGRDGIKWQARRVPNVAGIVRDMEMGRRSIPQRRFEGRPAGVDTRLLQRSIASRLAAPNVMEIGSTVPWASDVHRGGQHVIRISSIARKNFGPILARSRKRIAKGAGDQRDFGISAVGWILFRSSFKINVPARPFLFFSKQDRSDIGRMFLQWVKRADGPGPSDEHKRHIK